MKARLLWLLDAIRTNFWVIPVTMVAIAAALSYLMLELDHRMDLGWGWVYSGSADGAREVLSTISSSMITVAGVRHPGHRAGGAEPGGCSSTLSTTPRSRSRRPR